ncbi:Fe-S protein assembly chaperone HscA [Sesbania bispinosa]|nr:Fe-S protein assembly chaperone HscA [Sesbania bispinosa]
MNGMENIRCGEGSNCKWEIQPGPGTSLILVNTNVGGLEMQRNGLVKKADRDRPKVSQDAWSSLRSSVGDPSRSGPTMGDVGPELCDVGELKYGDVDIHSGGSNKTCDIVDEGGDQFDQNVLSQNEAAPGMQRLLQLSDGDINVVWSKGELVRTQISSHPESMVSSSFPLGELRLCEVPIILVEYLAAMGVHLREHVVATKIGPTKRRRGRPRKNPKNTKVSGSNLDFNLRSKILDIAPNKVADFVWKIGMKLGVYCDVDDYND